MGRACSTYDGGEERKFAHKKITRKSYAYMDRWYYI
jgi:hypothetical protein